jgi:hypothetical protein
MRNLIIALCVAFLVSCDKEKPAAPASPAKAPGAASLSRTKTIGGKGGKKFEQISEHHGILIGFRVAVEDLDGHPILKSLVPVYLADDERVPGPRLGDPASDISSVIAKPGYAVGALMIRHGRERIQGMRPIYMQIAGTGLNVADSYEGDWVGGGDGKEGRIGGNGRPIVGLFGAAGAAINSVGLIQEN